MMYSSVYKYQNECEHSHIADRLQWLNLKV